MLTLTRLSRRKLRMRWFFDVSKAKAFQISHFSGFLSVLSQMVLQLIRTNEIEEKKMIFIQTKKYLFFADFALSQR